MSGLGYVGANPVNPGDITNRLAVTTLTSAFTPNEGTVATQAAALAATYAAKTYVDSTHSAYVAPAYYQAQDLLNLPTSSVGIALGAASTDATTKVPLAQMPNVGAAYIQGAWGPTAVAAGTTDATPLKIADWNIGAAGISCRPGVFLLAFVSTLLGQPIIEIRISNSTTAPTSYGATTLVAAGVGRYGYNDFHVVAAMNTPDTTGESPSLLSPTYNVWLSAWLYDLTGNSVTLNTGGIASAAAYLVRGSL